MSAWPSTKAPRALKALLSIGWQVASKSKSGSHIQLKHRTGKFPDFTWGFHPNEELGRRMLARIAKKTGLTPDDL